MGRLIFYVRIHAWNTQACQEGVFFSEDKHVVSIKKLHALLFVFLLLPVPLLAAPSTNAKAVSPEQRKSIESIVHDYLISNPAVIREAIEALQKQDEELQQQQAALKFQQHAAELYQDPASPLGGNPNGDVTVVEFFDYQCGYCKKVAPAVEALIARDPNVRVVYKEFAILGQPSVDAARAALAAQRQGKFIEYHRALLGTDAVDDNTFKSIAEKLGLDYDAMQKDMADPALQAILDKNFALARELDITGTPAFVIGDRLIPGAVSVDALVDMVNKERIRMKGATVAAGKTGLRQDK